MAAKYSLTDVLDRMYHNKLALEATIMELTLRVGSEGAGENIRTALEVIGENAGFIKQGLANLKGKEKMI